MNSEEQEKFALALQQLGDIHNRKIGPEAMAIYFRVMEPYSWEQISNAMAQHAADPEQGMFFPLPAHLIGKLKKKINRPSADEMWALMPLSESDSAYWNQEAKQAFFRAAQPLIERNDMIGARMAFKGAYARLCEESDASQAPQVWEFSAGWSSDDREKVLKAALERGILEPKIAAAYLPHLNREHLLLSDDGLLKLIDKAKQC